MASILVCICSHAVALSSKISIALGTFGPSQSSHSVLQLKEAQRLTKQLPCSAPAQALGRLLRIRAGAGLGRMCLPAFPYVRDPPRAAHASLLRARPMGLHKPWRSAPASAFSRAAIAGPARHSNTHLHLQGPLAS